MAKRNITDLGISQAEIDSGLPISGSFYLKSSIVLNDVRCVLYAMNLFSYDVDTGTTSTTVNASLNSGFTDLTTNDLAELTQIIINWGESTEQVRTVDTASFTTQLSITVTSAFSPTPSIGDSITLVWKHVGQPNYSHTYPTFANTINTWEYYRADNFILPSITQVIDMGYQYDSSTWTSGTETIEMKGLFLTKGEYVSDTFFPSQNFITVSLLSTDTVFKYNSLGESTGVDNIYFEFNRPAGYGATIWEVYDNSGSLVTGSHFTSETDTSATLTRTSFESIGLDSIIIRASTGNGTIYDEIVINRLDDTVPAKAVYLKADGQVFTYDADDNPIPTNQTITFTTRLESLSGSITWDTNPVVTGLVVSTDTTYATLDINDFTGNDSVAVTATVGAFSDTVTVYKLNAGATGIDAVVGFLTNEVHVVPTDKDGILPTTTDLSTAGGTFKVYQGTTDITGTPLNYTGSTTQNGLTLTVNQDGTYELSTSTPSSWTTDSEVFNLTVSETGLFDPITKTYTIAKSRQGADGIQGPTGRVGWSHNIDFYAVTPLDSTLAWTGGTIKDASGSEYTVNANAAGHTLFTNTSYIFVDTSTGGPTYDLDLSDDHTAVVGADLILLGVAEQGVDELSLQIFGGKGGLKIAADQIIANSITANNIAASFYTGRAFTGSTFETRDVGDTSANIARVTMNSTDGFLIQDGANDAIFQASIDGTLDVFGQANIADISPTSIGGWPAATVTALQNRLGTEAVTPTSGGTFTYSALPLTLTDSTTITGDTPTSGVITHLSGNNITLFCRVYDPGANSAYSTNQNFTTPTYTVQFKYSTSPYSSWTNISTAITLTGWSENTYDGESRTWLCGYGINQSAINTTYNPGSGDYKIQAVVTRTGGSYSASRVISNFYYSEATVGTPSYLNLAGTNWTAGTGLTYTAGSSTLETATGTMIFGGLIGGTGEDLDNYTTTGWYHQRSNAQALLGSNYPGYPTQKAGLLVVHKDGSMVYQTYQVYSGGGGALYRRAKYVSTWSSWEQILTTGTTINAATATMTAAGASSTLYPTMVTAGTGDLPFYTRTSALSFTTSNGRLTATQFNASSDEKLKENIIPYDSEENITTYRFDFKEGSKNNIGYIAQDVQKYLPEAVGESEDGVLSVNYNGVFAAKIAKLEKIIKKLEEELEKLNVSK